jgi:hypothetical protein
VCEWVYGTVCLCGVRGCVPTRPVTPPPPHKQEEALAESNPDHGRVIRVAAETWKTGIVRDKRGQFIGTISAGGVIRDKLGRRVGVAGAQDRSGPKVTDTRVLDGYFGKAKEFEDTE